jgi:acyl-CoA synthetase (NDP forming)
VRESHAPAAAIDALFAQAGVIRVDTIDDMFDVGQLVAHQPLPAGPRVVILGNSDSLSLLAADACAHAGLELAGDPIDLGVTALPADFAAALDRALADDSIDSVLAQIIPSMVAADEDIARVLAAAARLGTKTVVATFLGLRGLPEVLRAGEGLRAVPSYSTPEDAVRALACVTTYARWRGTVPGAVVEPALRAGDANRRPGESTVEPSGQGVRRMTFGHPPQLASPRAAFARSTLRCNAASRSTTSPPVSLAAGTSRTSPPSSFALTTASTAVW